MTGRLMSLNKKTNKMKKKLKLSEESALRLYPTAAQEFKEILEETFGKEFFSQKITDRIKNYEDVCDILGVSSDDNDMCIEIDGFDQQDIKLMVALAKKIRIVKVYNQGWLPKVGENRYYPWLRVVAGSGLSFSRTDFGSSGAHTGSASRLCFKTSELSDDYAEKFIDVENDIIDLK